MAKENETIADIVAEMRDEGHTGESSCLEWVGTKMRYYADRLEAAYKRERGDCAKLRKAMEFIKQYFDKIDPFNINTYTFSQIEVEHINEVIDAALAAPARNCDLARDWIRDLYAHFQPPASVKREMPPEWVDAVMAFCRWLVAPATEQEGGAK